MIARISSAFLLLLISATFVSAGIFDAANTGHASAWVDPGWRRTVARYVVTFDEQGLSTTVFDFEILALNEKGAEEIAQQATAYNSYFDELSASDLATVTADGSVITVDERAIRDQPLRGISRFPDAQLRI
jgi:uncharacterized protein DUF3857